MPRGISACSQATVSASQNASTPFAKAPLSPIESLFGLFIQTILKLQGMFLRDDACPILNRASFDLREIVILIRKDVLYISFTLLSIKNYSCD